MSLPLGSSKNFGVVWIENMADKSIVKDTTKIFFVKKKEFICYGASRVDLNISFFLK